MGAKQTCCCVAEDKDVQVMLPLHKAATDEYAHGSAEKAEDGTSFPGESFQVASTKQDSGGFKQDPKKNMRPLKIDSAQAGRPAEAGRPGAIIIQLDRSQETNIGLNLDALDEETAFVDGILPGAIQTWNRTYPTQPTLQVYDRIVCVNSMTGETDQILREMRQSLNWNLVVDRPKELKIFVDCTKYPSLGLDLKYSPNGGSLLIASIGDGAIKDWNTKMTNGGGVGIEPRDRIIEVNSIRGSARDLLDAATNVTSLNLVILHYEANKKTVS